jgi:hypothetical protein
MPALHKTSSSALVHRFPVLRQEWILELFSDPASGKKRQGAEPTLDQFKDPLIKEMVRERSRLIRAGAVKII